VIISKRDVSNDTITKFAYLLSILCSSIQQIIIKININGNRFKFFTFDLTLFHQIEYLSYEKLLRG